MTTFRAPNGQFLPGYHSPNPTGRPKLKVSLTKLLQDRLESEPDTAQAIIGAWIDAAKEPDMRAIELMLDRLEGKVAEKHLNMSVIAHISEEYTKEVLEFMGQQELERENKLLLDEKNP